MIRRLLAAKRGSVALMTAVALVVIFGFGAISIDAGYAYSTWNKLNQSTQAAALSAAKDIGTGGSPISTATTYGADVDGMNQIAGVIVKTSTSLVCLKATVACSTDQTPTTSANAILVQQTAIVPLFFARVLGFNSITLKTEALALAAGSVPKKLNIEFVIDATASMGQTDPSCGMTKLDCALNGFKTLLGELWPCQYNTTCTPTPAAGTTVDQTALLQFPGVKTLPTGSPTTCSSLKTVAYNASPAPIYEIVSLSANYRNSDTASSLNTGSNLVNCANGLRAPGGFGTFYVDAITAAQADLVKNATPGVQNVIILESDGEANASTAPSSEAKNQCYEAVQAAESATTAGTWVFTISYGSALTGCTTDSGNYANPCYVMGQIASDPTKFYADDGAGCKSNSHPNITSIQQMFQNIGYSLTVPRLLPIACLGAETSSTAAGCLLLDSST